MKRQDRLRLKRFQESSAALKAVSIEATIVNFERIAVDLSEQIEAEEHRTRIAEPAHFAYSTLAKAARLRRTNLVTTIDDLKAKYEVAKREHEKATAELRTAESHESEKPADPAPINTIAPQPSDVLTPNPLTEVNPRLARAM
jgi:flagellar FliJ protein